MHRFAYNTTGFEVQPAMKMVGTYLAEIAWKGDREIKRRSENSCLHLRNSFLPGGFLCMPALPTQNKKEKSIECFIFL